jgi:glutathione S-transferase
VLELDDGTCLPESNAILWHLARGSRYMPQTPLEQDRMLAWLMFEQSEIEPVIGSARFWIQTGRSRTRREETDRRLAWGKQSLAVLDATLADRAFLLGAEPTIADVAVYGYVHLAPEIDLPLPSHVAVWCERIQAIPGHVKSSLTYDPKAMTIGPEP